MGILKKPSATPSEIGVKWAMLAEVTFLGPQRYGYEMVSKW